MEKTVLVSNCCYQSHKIDLYIADKILNGDYYTLDHNNRLVLKFHHQYIPSEFGKFIEEAIEKFDLPYTFNHTFNPRLAREYYQNACRLYKVQKMKKALKAKLISELEDDQNDD